MSHPEESAPCFNSAHTHANSSTPMTHFLCTGAARVLLRALTGNSTLIPDGLLCWVFFFFMFHYKVRSNHSRCDFQMSFLQPGGFSLHYLCVCVCFWGGFLSLCSLDLIVFSLLLPRLSTSPPPPHPPFLSAKKHKSLAWERGPIRTEKRNSNRGRNR